MNSKTIQESIINFFLNFTKTKKIESDVLYIIVSLIHYSIAVYLLISFIFNRFIPISILNSLIIITIIILFIFFKGCILTKIEQKLKKNDIIIGDQILDFFNIKKNKKNRLFLTILCNFTILFIEIVFILNNTILQGKYKYLINNINNSTRNIIGILVWILALGTIIKGFNIKSK